MESLRLHLIALGIEVCQALTGILQADPMPVPVLLRGNSSWSGIPHQEVKPIAIAPRRCLDHALALTIRNTVADGILHNRLQQKARNQAVDRTRVHIDLNSQPICETNLLDSQVVLD